MGKEERRRVGVYGRISKKHQEICQLTIWILGFLKSQIGLSKGKAGQLLHKDRLAKERDFSDHFCLQRYRFVMSGGEPSKQFFLITRAALREMKCEIKKSRKDG